MIINLWIPGKTPIISILSFSLNRTKIKHRLKTLHAGIQTIASSSISSHLIAQRALSPQLHTSNVLPFLLFDFAGNILDENGKEACLNVEIGRIHPDSAIHPFIFPEIQPPRSLFFFFEED